MYIYKQKHGEKANFFAQKKPIIMKMNLKLVETAAGSPARSCETMRRILKNWEKPAENDSSCSRDYNLFSWLLFLLLLHLIIRFGKCFAYCFRFRFHRILCCHFFCRVYFWQLPNWMTNPIDWAVTACAVLAWEINVLMAFISGTPKKSKLKYVRGMPARYLR